MRPSKRQPDAMRHVRITRNYTKHAEGSVLVEFGDTRVLCNASVEERVPPFLRGKGEGWVTAEYGMLPRSTNSRMGREAARGKQGGRTMEIQRLIGRSLRAVVDMKKLGERTITVDCDVLQADGGTRTASITGGFVALADAVQRLIAARAIREDRIANPNGDRAGDIPILRAAGPPNAADGVRGKPSLLGKCVPKTSLELTIAIGRDSLVR